MYAAASYGEHLRQRLDVAFPIGDSATLVGKNDAGKSSILEALGLFFQRAKTDSPREDASAQRYPNWHGRSRYWPV